LEENDVSNVRTGLIMGSGGPSTKNLFQAHQIVLEKGSPKRMGPFMVTRGMSSTNSACLATPFKIKGINYSITSACSTSAHCIGAATEQIQFGKQDVMFAGGGEELDWTLSCLFDAMGAMSSKYNDTPETAARAYDATRDGFVIAGGGGVVVLEELEHAKARGAKIYAEVTGYAANSDGYDMVAPSGEGGERCMRSGHPDPRRPQGRLHQLPRHLDPGGRHRRSRGDPARVRRKPAADLLHQVADRPQPWRDRRAGSDLLPAHAAERFHHGLGERHRTRSGPEAGRNRHERVDNAGLDTVLSNSFGFGGTNASLAMSRYHG
jgi:3-oxoacyl-[acyl-carrier-protein] synthase-1